MADSSPLLKLFIGYPLTGELKGALKSYSGWENDFEKTEHEGVTYLGKYIDKIEIEPKEIEAIASDLDSKLGSHVPEIILHLPKAVIIPKVLIS